MKNSVNFKKISIYGAPERSPGFLLWHISTTWRTSIEKVLKPLELTHPQFVILAAIGWLTRDGDSTTQADLGKMAALDPNTVSQVIRGLEQKELITRKISSDRRAKNPSLTKKGSDALKKAIPAVEKRDGEFFHDLTTEEMNCMIVIFQQLTPN